MDVENQPKMKGNYILLEGPIFDFHDYGRKGRLSLRFFCSKSFQTKPPQMSSLFQTLFGPSKGWPGWVLRDL